MKYMTEISTTVAGVATLGVCILTWWSFKLDERIAELEYSESYSVSVEGPNLVFSANGDRIGPLDPVAVTPLFLDYNNSREYGARTPLRANSRSVDLDGRTITYRNVLGADGEVCFKLENREYCATHEIEKLLVEYEINGSSEAARPLVPSS